MWILPALILVWLAERQTTFRRIAAVWPIIVQEAARNRLPPALLAGIVEVESGGRSIPNRTRRYWGLMQLSVEAARTVGYAGSAPGLLDASTNIRIGASYLRRLTDLCGGDLAKALTAYNMGRCVPIRKAYVRRVSHAAGLWLRAEARQELVV
jgi:soluble lytic murein transglycosylase-like protein